MSHPSTPTNQHEDIIRLSGDPKARLVGAYPVWRLPDDKSWLRDAEDTGEVHYHVETSSGVEYLYVSLHEGRPRLEQGGNAAAAEPYLRAARTLAAPAARVLLARGTTALWDPATGEVAVVASSYALLASGRLLSGPAFEAALSQSGLAVNDYVRFSPDGERGACWVEGEVTRVHQGVVLEILPRVLGEGWTLAPGSRVDPSYDLQHGGVLRRVEPLTTQGPRTWARLSPLSPREPRTRRAEYQGAHGVRVSAELRQEGRREFVVAYFTAPDEHRGYAACLRVATQLLDAVADAASGAARPPVEDLADRASLAEDAAAHRWPRGGLLELHGAGAWAALTQVLEPSPPESR